MKPKKYKPFDLIEHIKRYFSITPYQDIVSWCLQNINMSDDISSLRNKPDFSMYPYQIPILKLWLNENKAIKTIAVVAVEQVGKTAMFVDGILYNMVFSPCQSLIVYPNDLLAIATNQTKLKPLMRHIPQLKLLLDKPKSCKSDCYKFSNLISYFQGAGSKIVSRSCKIVVGDLCDAWPVINGIDNVADLKKRTRSYNSSICFLISTPTVKEGRIWRAFLKGSQGYWFLRCKGCGELTMRSCDIHNLQFESDLNLLLKERIVKPLTIRLICPECKHLHVEADKAWMNINGGFKHLIPLRLATYPSFQIGALASQLPSLSWLNIANAQLEAGKRNDILNQMTFDNSFRGLPYHRRLIVKEDLLRIKDHCYRSPGERLKQEDILFVFGAVDSMGNYWRYGIFASDTNDNIHVIKIGEVNYLTLTELDRQKHNDVAKQEASVLGTKYEPILTLEDVINATYCGFEPLIVGIDAHATYNYAEVQKFIKDHPKVIGYLGNRMTQTRYKESSVRKNFLVSAVDYKVDTIYYLYSQKKRNNLYLFFYEDIEDKYVNLIAAMKPDPNSKFGNQPENWSSLNREDHAFDCIKMGYWVRDMCIEQEPLHLKKDRFNYAQSPRLKRRFEQKQVQPVVEAKKELLKKTNNNWIDGHSNWING